MKLEIPESLRLREEAICKALRRATDSGGETGDAAALLEAILLPHLAKEKADVLQPLGLLAPLARGGFSRDPAEVLAQIDQMKNEPPMVQPGGAPAGRSMGRLEWEWRQARLT